MTHGCFLASDRKFSLGLLCLMVTSTFSCKIPADRHPAAGGSGGASGSGGVSGSSGSAGKGGSTASSSGGQAGSSSTSEVGGADGSIGGAGGSTEPPPANIPCTSDAECTPTGQFCEPATKLCVPCVKTADCPSGGHCLGNHCVTYKACSSKSECTSSAPVCDPKRGVCVQCTAITDCPAGQDCYGNKCEVVETCKVNSDCSTGICDAANGRCIECLQDGDCSGTNMQCVLNNCRHACTKTADCASFGMVCDTSHSACVQCLSAKDCPASWYCLVNACVPDVCDSTLSSCENGNLASCNADGDAFDNFTTCGASKPCSVRGAVAGCGGMPADGGTSPDAVVPTSDANPPSCGSTGTMADLCKSGIPKFSGTQTVDGSGKELCSLPYFTFSAQNAAKVFNYNNVPTSQLETATARIGWDAAGLHVYVEVQDSSVQTVNMKDASQATSKAYLGDSIELFFSSNDNVTGLTSNDSNALHVIIPANGPAVSVKDTGSSGTSSALATSQFGQTATSTGYAVEALIPWPGTAPSSGSAIRFDMAINSADRSFDGVDKMRDGQLEYYIGTLSGSSTCQTSDGTVPWCDDRTWCQVNLQ